MLSCLEKVSELYNRLPVDRSTVAGPVSGIPDTITMLGLGTVDASGSVVPGRDVASSELVTVSGIRCVGLKGLVDGDVVPTDESEADSSSELVVGSGTSSSIKVLLTVEAATGKSFGVLVVKVPVTLLVVLEKFVMLLVELLRVVA